MATRRRTRRRSGNPLTSGAAESGWSELPAAGQSGGRGREEHSDGDHAAVLPTDVRRLGRRRRCRLLPVRQASRPERTDRAGPDSCRHARPGGRAQVRHTDADPAGHAQGGHDQTAGRQAPRLLRDLDAADPAADSPRRPPQDHGLGVRRGRGGEQPRAAHPQRSLAHDRGDVEQAGPCEVDQRPRRRERGLPPASASRRPDPALGQPTGRHSRSRQPPDVRRDTRRVHGPGADRHARARRRRRGRRQRRLRGSLVPARVPATSRRAMPPRAPGTTSSPARPPGRTASSGGLATRPSSTRTRTAPRRSGTTTTRSA